ncbi:Fc.00g061200.m01.CDS01 [Cosmosporella sp. VM-42]
MATTEAVAEQMQAMQISEVGFLLSLPSRALTTAQFNKPYQLVTAPIPKIKPYELLIRIYAAGFCHSDIQVLQGQFNTQLPLIPCHEPAGVIAQVGSECTGGWEIGDRVGALNFKNACSRCTGCALSKRRYGGLDPRFCEKREMAGFKHDGCLAEYMAADPMTTVLLPNSLPFDQAAPLMCAGATVWGALEKATVGLEPGATIAIVGIGGLGHLGVQFAKALGYKVIAVDCRAASRSLAREAPPDLKADIAVDSTSPSASTEILSFTKEEGIAAAIVCTDSLDANAWVLTLLRIGGVMVPLGLPPEKWQFDAEVLVFRELVVRGSYVASAESTKRMMEVVENSGIRSRITRLRFEDVPRMAEVYHDKGFSGRLVVQVVDCS